MSIRNLTPSQTYNGQIHSELYTKSNNIGVAQYIYEIFVAKIDSEKFVGKYVESSSGKVGFGWDIVDATSVKDAFDTLKAEIEKIN